MPTYEIHIDFDADSWDAANEILQRVDASLREKGLAPPNPDLHRFYLRDVNAGQAPEPLRG